MNKKHLGFLIILASAGAFLLTNTPAKPTEIDNQPATRVAVCDIEQIYANYDRARGLIEKLNESRQAILKENEDRGKSIETLQMELEQLKVGSKEYEDRFNELQRLTIERQSWLQLKEAIILREHARLTTEMYGEITGAIERIARQDGYDVVLFRENKALESREPKEILDQIRSRKVLYAKPSCDITQRVLSSMNEAYRSSGPQ